MDTLDTYIGNLLYHHQCVIIPSFGAFIANYKSAFFTDEGVFLPPSKEIAFNSSLTTNDGLLVKYISEVREIDYEQTQQLIDQWVDQWWEELKEFKVLKIEKIGTIKWVDEQRLVFEPLGAENFLKESFGMASLSVQPIQEKPFEQKIKIKEILTVEWAKYAAIFVIFFSVISLSWYVLKEQMFFSENEQFIFQKNQQQVSEASFFINPPKRVLQKSVQVIFLPTVNIDKQSIEIPDIKIQLKHKDVKEIHNQGRNNFYFWIAGAFSEEHNAIKRVEELKKIGFEEASIIGKNTKGLFLVAFIGFQTQKQANQYRINIKNKGMDTWLFHLKL